MNRHAVWEGRPGAGGPVLLLAESTGVSLADALELLHRYAEKERRPLTAVARAPAERSLRPEDLLGGEPRRA